MRERPPHLLLLGGTAEAAALARALADRFGDRLAVTYSLAGRAAPRARPPGRLRIGGFAGPEGLAVFLRDEGVRLLVDATHPFAARMSRNAHIACEVTGTPRLTLRRPEWEPQPGDDWHEVDDVADAAEAAARLGRRAFITLGTADLAPFRDRPGFTYVVRMMDPPDDADDDLPVGAALVGGRGPFTVDDEDSLMRSHGVDVLVTKASGGNATRAKLDAARRLGLPVVLIRRPAPEPGTLVETVDEALEWIASVARLD
ncbi:Cobalt-precorrin-6x reductase [Caenispirillum salinarum AK4]|uniref:Cobalt-precorrin-6x reductase n=1 Tax=Caenispirillum salinarum AK4 TaxID=1238182 RepID=K9H5P5_9PROT|nr:cobalt-precorrin-6A reductase [Caenispirillum salinarum]EKV32424.1 Cobalt-precorrin-6x reductase [Caenispirillum salinarum AK4]